MPKLAHIGFGAKNGKITERIPKAYNTHGGRRPIRLERSLRNSILIDTYAKGRPAMIDRRIQKPESGLIKLNRENVTSGTSNNMLKKTSQSRQGTFLLLMFKGSSIKAPVKHSGESKRRRSAAEGTRQYSWWASG